jgi:hypothetical protein
LDRGLGLKTIGPQAPPAIRIRRTAAPRPLAARWLHRDSAATDAPQPIG